jgi:DNA-directed RNA polymerase specialized sigma24 family protein
VPRANLALTGTDDAGAVIAIPSALLLWQCWPRLVGFAVSRGLRHHDAQDLASAALLQVLGSKGLAHVREPWPYLRTTLVHLMLNESQHAAREKAAHRDCPPPRSAMGDADIANRDEVERLLHRLASIEPPETFAMVRRRLVDGTCWEQLAEEFGVSASAARSRVGRALARLREWARRRGVAN